MTKSVWHCPICHMEGTDPTVIRCPEDGCAVDLVVNRENVWVGKIINQTYRIVQFLGAGGMADVFEAEELNTHKNYALKILKPEFARDKELNQRFRQEAMLISRIAHPNIVSLQDFGITDDGHNYMAMELLTGCSLADAMRNEPLDPEVAFYISLLICEGMAAAHERGVIHRDLKPDNVFVHSADNNTPPQIKILDLGIGKLFNSSVPKGITLSGTIVGTPQYMSPEQCMGKDCTVASDIYSMGILLYQMLFGVVPFEDEAPLLVLPRHISEKPRWDKRVANRLGIPEKAKNVVLKALAKKPADRQESMRHLQKEISSLLSRARQGDRFSIPAVEDSLRVLSESPSTSVLGSPSVSPLATSPTIAAAVSPEGHRSPHSDDDQFMPIEFTAHTFWMGRRHKTPLECNPYLRVFEGNGKKVSMLINTGPLRDLNVIAQKVVSVVDSFENIDYVFVSQSDPDISGCLGEIQRINPHISVICSQETWSAIRYQGLDPRQNMPIESFSNRTLTLPTGHQLQFIETPFCPVRGAMMMYDAESSVLFSTALFSNYAVRSGFVYTFQDDGGLKKFHQSRMPSALAISAALEKISNIGATVGTGPRIIAPHYGNIVTDENVERVIELVGEMQVGMELMKYNESHQDALSIANQIAGIFSSIAGKENTTALLNRFANDRALVGLLDIRIGSTITGFRIEFTDAINTLIQTAQDNLSAELAAQFSGAVYPLREQLLMAEKESSIPPSKT